MGHTLLDCDRREARHDAFDRGERNMARHDRGGGAASGVGGGRSACVPAGGGKRVPQDGKHTTVPPPFTVPPI